MNLWKRLINAPAVRRFALEVVAALATALLLTIDERRRRGRRSARVSDHYFDDN